MLSNNTEMSVDNELVFQKKFRPDVEDHSKNEFSKVEIETSAEASKGSPTQITSGIDISESTYFNCFIMIK